MVSRIFYWFYPLSFIFLLASICQPNLSMAREVKKSNGSVVLKKSPAAQLDFQSERKRLKQLLRALRKVRAEINRLTQDFEVLEKRLQKLDEQIKQLRKRLALVKEDLENISLGAKDG